MIEAEITLPENPELLALLRSEAATFRHARATYTLASEQPIRLHVSADDAIALRATVTSITRVLAIHERATDGEGHARQDPAPPAR